MVIGHNLLAMNAQRQFSIAGNNKKKSTEKLASGYKINRAADDAAGLSISEKMRRQIRGLDQGARNTQDGISLLQVADGALCEVHEMLHRMNELAVQAANGTNTISDRRAIQLEIDQIKDEIDRVGKTTSFNENKIFTGDRNIVPIEKDEYVEGDLSDISSHEDDHGSYIDFSVNVYSNQDLYYLPPAQKSLDGKTYTVGLSLKDVKERVYKSHNSAWLTVNEVRYQVVYRDNTKTVQYRSRGEYHPLEDFESLENPTHSPVTVRYLNFEGAAPLITDHNGDGVDDYNPYIVSSSGLRDAIMASAIKAYTLDNAFSPATAEYTGVEVVTESHPAVIYNNFRLYKPKVAGEKEVINDKKLWIQSGAESNDGMYITIPYMNDQTLGIKNVNVLTEKNAGKTIDSVNNAINIVSGIRSGLGAQQNRLEHTYKNVTNISENTQVAESRIRDTDMAKEMVNLSTHNVLEQVGTSMITQANQTNQGVLNLLQ